MSLVRICLRCRGLGEQPLNSAWFSSQSVQCAGLSMGLGLAYENASTHFEDRGLYAEAPRRAIANRYAEDIERFFIPILMPRCRSEPP